MRSPSACSSMSSHTQPQNVQVAFFTTVSSIPHCLPSWCRRLACKTAGEPPAPRKTLAAQLAVRTGRDGEGSAEGAALAAAADAARHVPPRVDLLPGANLVRLGLGGELGGRRLIGLGGPVARCFGLHRYFSCSDRKSTRLN